MPRSLFVSVSGSPSTVTTFFLTPVHVVVRTNRDDAMQANCMSFHLMCVRVAKAKHTQPRARVAIVGSGSAGSNFSLAPSSRMLAIACC